MSERNRAITGLIWKFLERSGYQTTSFIITLILARILSPDEYGVVAIVVAIVAILQVFVDSGMGTALIQKKTATEEDFSTVLLVNIVISFFIYVLVFLASPLISSVYTKDLTALLRTLSLIIIVFGVKNVFQAYIIRSLQFKKIFLSSLIGIIMGGATGIFLALHGFGTWAIVFQQLLSEIICTITLIIIVKWKPKFTFSWISLNEVFGFGWKLLISSLIDTLYNNIRQLLIGKYYTSDNLAYYSKGDQVPNILVNNINTTMNSVLLPILAQNQDNKQEIKSISRRIIKTSSFVIWPMMLGLIAVADKLICLLLTEKWLPAVVFVRILALSYCLQPLQTTNLNILKSIGRTDICLKLEITKKIIAFALIIFSLKFGVLAVAGTAVLYSVIASIINAFPNNKLIDYSYLEQIKDIFPSMILSFIMMITVFCIGFLDLPIVEILFFQIIVGICVYFFGAKLFKVESLVYVISYIKDIFSKL